MLDKDLLNSFETLEKLQDEEIIQYYKFNSKEWDFIIITKYGEKNLNIYETDEVSILEFINEMRIKKEIADKEAEEEAKEYYRQIENDYWSVQGAKTGFVKCF